MSLATWQPILEGPLAAKAWSVILEIAASLKQQSFDTPDVASGSGGVALFYHWLFKALPHGQEYAALSDQLLETMREQLTSTELGPGLFTGFSGVALTLELLGKNTQEDANEEIDQALWEYLDRPVWEGDYELIVGLVGLGVYFLARRDRPQARRCLLRILDHLEATAEKQPRGVSWRTPFYQPPSPVYYHIGLAHGVPGVLGFLGRLLEADIAPRRVHPLLESGVSWLLSQKSPQAAPSYFPSEVVDGASAHQAWMGWCWGDPGVAMGLFRAARGAHQPTWEQEALSIALAAADLSIASTGVMDAGFCHGASGIAHLFNRLYQSTGDLRLLSAAQRWLWYTLTYHQPGEGFGGFLFNVGHEPSSEQKAIPGVLGGSAGVALSLLAAVSHVAPTWDQIFLLSSF
jgi:lantibiotic biosynthesis protein